MAAARTVTASAAGILAVALLATGCGGTSGKKITVAAVGRGEVREVVQAPATVTAKAAATMTSPASGRVGKLLVADGAIVKRGQTLMVIASPAVQLRLRQAKQADAKAASGDQPAAATDLTGLLGGSDAAADQAFSASQQAINLITDPKAKAKAQAQLTQSKSRYAYSRYRAEQAIQSLDRGIGGISRALTSVAQAQRTQTHAAVVLAQQAVSALTIKAPIAGIVQLGGAPAAGGSGDLAGALDQLPSGVQGQAAQLLAGSGSSGSSTSTTVSIGTPVDTGATLGTITDGSRLTLSADVDETDVLLVKRGVGGSAELDAVPDATYHAVVQLVGQTPTTSAEGGVTYRVRLALLSGHNADGTAAPRPRPGMSAVVNLLVRHVKNGLRVPAAAVIHDGSKDFVWVDDSGGARKTYVTLGAQGDDELQVLSGLRQGDRIVVSNAVDVTKGQKLPQ